MAIARVKTLLPVSIVLGAAALGACDRNIEDYVPDERAREPDLARILPPEQTALGQGATGGSAPGARTSLPPPRGEAAAGGADASLRGTIEVAPELASQVPRGGVVFVIARPAGASGGPPLAVLRISSPSFPLPFELGPQNAMMPGTTISGQMDLSARLDRDGDALTRDAGDLSGALSGPIFAGSSGIRLVLDSKYSGDLTPLAQPPPRTRAEVPGSALASSGGTISGTIRLAPRLSGEAPKSGVLFVYARRPGVERGPPIAVLRLPTPSFPVAFELGPKNVMIPSMTFNGEMNISARLDADGNAMSRSPGDVQGAVAGTTTPGVSGVELVLDQRL